MASPSSEHTLNERAQRLLKVLVERYIRDGEPVGSRYLAKESGLDLSPASIRNILAEIEDMGFIRSPHTSAGRVPTVQGYRFFVDTLLTVKPLEAREVLSLRDSMVIEDEFNPQAIIDNASNLLSAVTRMAGVIMLPRREHVGIRHIEFLPLSENRILAILVFQDNKVQNRVMHANRKYTQAELQQAANYLNAHFVGKDLPAVRQQLLADMNHAHDNVNELMGAAVQLAERVIKAEDKEDYIIAGQANLIDFKELSSNAERLRAIFDAFTSKRDILHLLDQAITADGVQIFIGDEAGYQVLDECSIVTTPYEVNNQVVGVLGVIGPTRMAYDRVIPIVDMTAKLLGVALNFRD